MDLTTLIPAVALPWVLIALAVVTVLGLAVGVYFKLKNRNISGALADGQKLLEAVTSAVSIIKNKTTGDSRLIVKDALKSTGKTLEEAGLKEKLDAFLRDRGLSETS